VFFSKGRSKQGFLKKAQKLDQNLAFQTYCLEISIPVTSFWLWTLLAATPVFFCVRHSSCIRAKATTQRSPPKKETQTPNLCILENVGFQSTCFPRAWFRRGSKMQKLNQNLVFQRYCLEISIQLASFWLSTLLAAPVFVLPSLVRAFTRRGSKNETKQGSPPPKKTVGVTRDP
jgi:hypothetical protein